MPIHTCPIDIPSLSHGWSPRVPTTVIVLCAVHAAHQHEHRWREKGVAGSPAPPTTQGSSSSACSFIGGVGICGTLSDLFDLLNLPGLPVWPCSRKVRLVSVSKQAWRFGPQSRLAAYWLPRPGAAHSRCLVYIGRSRGSALSFLRSMSLQHLVRGGIAASLNPSLRSLSPPPLFPPAPLQTISKHRKPRHTGYRDPFDALVAGMPPYLGAFLPQRRAQEAGLAVVHMRCLVTEWPGATHLLAVPSSITHRNARPSRLLFPWMQPLSLICLPYPPISPCTVQAGVGWGHKERGNAATTQATGNVQKQELRDPSP